MAINHILNSLKENKNILFTLGIGAIIILILVVKFALKKGCCPLLNRMTGQVENKCDDGECFPKPVTPHLVQEPEEQYSNDNCENGVCPIPQNVDNSVQEVQQTQTEDNVPINQNQSQNQDQNQENIVDENEEKEKVE